MDSNKVEKGKKPAMVVLISIVVSIIVLIIGVVGMKTLASMKTPPVETKNGESPLRVEALQITKEDAPVFITGYGEVKALNVVPISSEVSGKIVQIHSRLEAGEMIPKGENLFKIDSANYTASHEEARGVVQQWKNAILRLKKQYAIDTKRLKTIERNRELAKAEFERIRKLFESNNIGTLSGVEKSEQVYNSALDQADQMAQAVALYPIRIKEAESSLSSVQARLAFAKSNLMRCQVLAPFNGRVKSVSLEKGQYVTPGQNVVTLADDSVLEIQVPIDSRDAREWLRFNGEKANGKTAWFACLEQVLCKIRWTENNNGQTWDGQLHRVVKFDQQTRTLTLAVRVYAETAMKKNLRSLPLAEGMFCSVKIPGRTLNNVFRLPRKAVSFENTVHIAVDNRLKTVPVKVARMEGENVYVYGGLNAGDMVVTTRLIDPMENALLKITNKSKKEIQS
ncbi:MAG: efflux RND transporter periplasmic adaptor subunit [Desulfatiglans sp.]|jgi:RND family efflux transporter MFP subunit|nr:efflux RND transporter periplasmic adaptor subunit [Desulfatiglans sp.]